MGIVRASGQRRDRRLDDDVEIYAPEDIEEIRHVSRYRFNEYENCKNIARAHRLVRQGFLSRTKYSEQVRGERRFYWWRFEVTEKGKAFLAAALPRSPAPKKERP